ncbi:MAG: EamA family transporter [Firmicutes bacterium]|mgnify:CR=1 FL=1|nr:EamA family transporter [Bacillota bacterium]
MTFSSKSFNRHSQGIILLAIAALLWSCGGFLIKWVVWNPLAIAGTRSLIAAGLMYLYRRKFDINWSPAQIGGAIAYAATVISFVTANKLTTAANAILIQYTAPVFVALFANWFLGEKTSRLDWVMIGITLGGMALFFLDDLSLGNFWGNLVALFSGIAFAGVVLFSRKQKDGSPLESFFLGNILTGLVGLPFMLGSAPNPSGWIGLILLGVFQLGISYIVYAEAMKRVTALEGILIPIIEPILNPVWVFLLMGEVPGKWAVIGGVIVVTSVTLRCILTAGPGKSSS